MKIIDTNLEFGELKYRTLTTEIILHHAAATTMSVEQIHNLHKANGWSGIGYHFYIRKDGSIYRGRPEGAVGAHASGSNSDSVGICFEGNFENETMPDVQKKSGKWLVGYIKHKYNISKVKRHTDVNATACPGIHFPFDDIASAVYEEDGMDIRYQVHCQTYGWMKEVRAGETAGTIGEAKRLEAIVINSDSVNFKYRVHCQTLGDGPLLVNGQVAGTVGIGKRIEAIWIDADKPVKYRVHQQGTGWTDWCSNGIWCGTKGKYIRIEAIEIMTNF